MIQVRAVKEVRATFNENVQGVCYDAARLGFIGGLVGMGITAIATQFLCARTSDFNCTVVPSYIALGVCGGFGALLGLIDSASARFFRFKED